MTTEVKATLVEGAEGEAGAVVVELPTTEVETPTGSDAVAIAQIEADANVTIAAIHADTETTAIEARANTDAEIAALRERNAWLEAEANTTTQRLVEAQAEISRLTPPLSPVEAVEELTEIVEALDPATMDTPETATEMSSETETEAREENVEGNPEVVSALLARPVKRVIRLL